MRYLPMTVLALGVSVAALAGETVTEHETYEKRSMKVETMQAPTTTTVPGRTVERTVEETETTRTDRPRVVEKHTTVVPGPVVRERKTEKIETDDGD